MLLLEGSVKLLSSGSGMLHSEASGMLLHVNAQPRSAYAARACHPIAGGVFPLSWVRDGLSNVREDCPNAPRAPRRIQSRAGAAAPKQSKFGVCRRETEQSRGVSPRNPPGISLPRRPDLRCTRATISPANRNSSTRTPGFALDRRPATDNLMVYGCGVEQLVARRAHNPEVVGSSPTPAST